MHIVSSEPTPNEASMLEAANLFGPSRTHGAPFLSKAFLEKTLPRSRQQDGNKYIGRVLVNPNGPDRFVYRMHLGYSADGSLALALLDAPSSNALEKGIQLPSSMQRKVIYCRAYQDIDGIGVLDVEVGTDKNDSRALVKWVRDFRNELNTATEPLQLARILNVGEFGTSR